MNCLKNLTRADHGLVKTESTLCGSVLQKGPHHSAG